MCLRTVLPPTPHTHPWVYLGLTVSVRSLYPRSYSEALCGPSEAAGQSAVIPVNTVSLSDSLSAIVTAQPTWWLCPPLSGAVVVYGGSLPTRLHCRSDLGFAR